MENPHEYFVRNLQRLAERPGAVNELATKLGVHRVTASRYVNGRCPITLDIAARIASHFGKTLAEMLQPPPQPPPNVQPIRRHLLSPQELAARYAATGGFDIGRERAKS